MCCLLLRHACVIRHQPFLHEVGSWYPLITVILVICEQPSHVNGMLMGPVGCFSGCYFSLTRQETISLIRSSAIRVLGAVALTWFIISASVIDSNQGQSGVCVFSVFFLHCHSSFDACSPLITAFSICMPLNWFPS